MLTSEFSDKYDLLYSYIRVRAKATSVVEDKSVDDDAMRQTKEFIRAMTPIVPKQKFADQDMPEICNVLLEVGIIAHFIPKNLKSISEIFLQGIRNNCQSETSITLLKLYKSVQPREQL